MTLLIIESLAVILGILYLILAAKEDVAKIIQRYHLNNGEKPEFSLPIIIGQFTADGPL